MRSCLVFAAALLFALAATASADEGGKCEKEKRVTLDQVPAAVKATILKEAKGAKIKELEKEVKKGKVVYEAEFIADGKEIEIKVAPDGKLLEREVEDEEHREKEGRHEDDDDDDDDDDGEREVKVTLDQVPAAVKAAILKAAGGAKIKEIEKEVKKGKVVYEAEFVADGKEIEIKVAPDGKLLGRKVEADDDDDDDDDEK